MGGGRLVFRVPDVLWPGLYRMRRAQRMNAPDLFPPISNAFFMAIRQPAGVSHASVPFNVPYSLCSRSFALPVATEIPLVEAIRIGLSRVDPAAEILKRRYPPGVPCDHCSVKAVGRR